MDLAAEALVMRMERDANDALDAIDTRRFDLHLPAALFEHTGGFINIAAVGDGMIAEPPGQHLAIGNGRLAEAEQRADFGALSFERAVAHVHRVERLRRRIDLSCDSADGFDLDFRGTARKAAMGAVEKQQHRERQPACLPFGCHGGPVCQAKRPTFGPLKHALIHRRLTAYRHGFVRHAQTDDCATNRRHRKFQALAQCENMLPNTNH